MQDNYISKAALCAILLWTATALLLAAVWGLALIDIASRWARPLAVLACVSACVAVVSHLRVWQLRLCAMIRASTGMDSAAPSAEIRALR